MAIMTSYNLINGIHAANCGDICTKAARCEWGFQGDRHDGLDHNGAGRRLYGCRMHEGGQRFW